MPEAQGGRALCAETDPTGSSTLNEAWRLFGHLTADEVWS